MLSSIKIKPLLSNEAHVWHVNFSKQLNKIPFFISLLSKDEKEKASKYRFEKDKNQFVISRGTLRVLSAHYLSMSAKKIQFNYYLCYRCV